MTNNNSTPNYETSLSKVNNVYFPLIERQLVGNGMDMDEYSKSCVLNAISSINNTLEVAGIDWNNPQLDQGNVTQILLSVASLKLNSSAHPNEVYFQVRNVKIKKNGKDEWKKQIEMGIEGDGNDAILSRFGRGIEEVRSHWVVREGDDFSYPSFDGLEMSPPKWTPKGTGKVVKVVYPIIKKSGAVEFHISEREDVIRNLIAHVNNNLMNETFGIAESRYKATKQQKEQIQAKKDEIMNRVEELGLDGALADEEIRKHISPAWKDKQSKESMILRKMRNNIVKKIPKDFGNVLSEIQYENTTNDYKKDVIEEINNNANKEEVDFDMKKEKQEEAPEDIAYTDVEEEKQEQEEAEKHPQEQAEEEGQQSIYDIADALEQEDDKSKKATPF